MAERLTRGCRRAGNFAVLPVERLRAEGGFASRLVQVRDVQRAVLHVPERGPPDRSPPASSSTRSTQSRSIVSAAPYFPPTAVRIKASMSDDLIREKVGRTLPETT